MNGLLVNRDQILSLRPLLIDLTAQGQKQDLSSPNYYINCLDKFGGTLLTNLLNRAKKAWHDWRKVSRELQDALSDLENKKEQFSFLKNLRLGLMNLQYIQLESLLFVFLCLALSVLWRGFR